MYADLEVLTIGPHTLLKNPPRIILDLIVSITIESTYVKILQSKRIYTLNSYNFCISTPILIHVSDFTTKIG